MANSLYRMTLLKLEHKLKAVKPELLVACGNKWSIIQIRPDEEAEMVYLIMTPTFQDGETVGLTAGDMVERFEKINKNYYVAVGIYDESGNFVQVADLAETLMIIEGTDDKDQSMVYVGLMIMPDEDDMSPKAVL